MAVQQTSKQAYCTLHLGRRQREVLRLLAGEDLTNLQLSKRLGIPINAITGRTKELREMGLVIDRGIVRCLYTGRRVHKWGVPIEGGQLRMFS